MATPRSPGAPSGQPSARRIASGCALVVLAVAVLALVLWRTLPPRPRHPDDVPFVAALAAGAAFFFVMALACLWGLAGYWGWRGAAQKALARRRDPRTLHRGRVVAEGAPLLAPLSGTPCVAYAYRLTREADRRSERGRLACFGGVAATAFTLDLGDRRLPVRALPRLDDELQALDGPQALARARRLVAEGGFEARGGLEGAIGLMSDMLSDLHRQPIEPGQPFRRDWHNPDHGTHDVARFALEEVVLPPGAVVALFGWVDATREAVRPVESTALPTRVAASTEGMRAIEHEAATTKPSGTTGVVLMVVLAAIGAALLALARHV